MISVGIRELKAHLSQYMHKVKQGESIAITEHGEIVAVLSPSAALEKEEKMWGMVRDGVMEWNGGHPQIKNRKRIKIKGKPMSQTVIEMRREERY